jgi:hypothetical protein
MKWESAYWKCNGKLKLSGSQAMENAGYTERCNEPLTVTLDLGPPVEMVKGHMRIPALYSLGCMSCGYQKNSRLMLINPWTDDTEIGDLHKGGDKPL